MDESKVIAQLLSRVEALEKRFEAHTHKKTKQVYRGQDMRGGLHYDTVTEETGKPFVPKTPGSASAGPE